MYAHYVIVYFAIVYHDIKIVYKQMCMWSLKLFDNRLFILETGYRF